MNARTKPPDDQMPLLADRMAALRDTDIPLTEWEDQFVSDVCRQNPLDLTVKQQQWVAILCWRHRKHLAPELAPASDPTPPKQRRGAR